MSSIPSTNSHFPTPTPSPAQSTWDEESFFNEQYRFPPSGSQTPTTDSTHSTSSNASTHPSLGTPSPSLNHHVFPTQPNMSQAFPIQPDSQQVYATPSHQYGPDTQQFYVNPNHQYEPDTQQVYAAPSHKYDQHRQQTSFPPGAVKNTMALNPPGFDFDQYQSYSGPSSGGYLSEDPTLGMSNGLDLNTDFSFGSPPDVTPTNNGGLYTDAYVELCVDPAVVGGPEEFSPLSILSQGNTARLWPGIHKQTAMAKAQAKGHGQPQQPENPSSVPTSVPASKPKNSLATDPLRNEIVTRLLREMRDNTMPPPTDDEVASPNATGTASQRAKAKKDLADMDADELLLNSEEGKLLPSKERRQLRNKVSARAFRHRRKEYISQLEEELEAATTLADSLKAKNAKLMAENASLMKLSQMLVHSPEFSGLVDGLTRPHNTPAPLPASAPQMMSMSSIEPEQQQPMAQNQITPYQDPYQAFPQAAPNPSTGPQVGMVFV